MPVKGVPASWLNWGGERPGAGRPKLAEPTVRIGPRVKTSTKQKLERAAFAGPKTVGQVIDALVEEKEKKTLDKTKKKK